MGLIVGGGRVGCPLFFSVVKPFAYFSLGVVQRGGGRGRADKHVIHIASMPKTLLFTVFSPVCTTHCAKDVA